MILALFLGVVAVLILALIFKGKLIELFGSFAGITKSKTFWIIIILTLAIVFRKFVLEILMWILKILKGVLRI